MTYTETLVVTHCWCGIALAIPSNLNRVMHDEGKSCYCPVGHSFVYGETNEDKLRAERERHRATRDLLAAEERSHQATRGHLTRAKKRSAAGVCPCCHRTFKQLRKHMNVKHPEYVEQAREATA
jgi:hypothetical protein